MANEPVGKERGPLEGKGSAFTFIELLLVIAIVAGLASRFMPGLTGGD